MMEEETLRPEIKMKGGIFIKKSLMVFLCIFFVCGCVTTGLTVHYVSQDDSSIDSSEPDTQDAVLKVIAKEEEKSESDLRLPSNLTPVHYVVNIQPFVHGQFNFSTRGHLEITFTVNEATSSVIFHMLDIITVNETIKLVPGTDLSTKGLEFTSHAYDVSKQFYIGTLATELKKGESYTISMDFIGYLNDILAGFYRSVYDQEGKDILLGTTQFQPTDARRAFPCFDEPALKATFDISMAREEGMEAISNMPKISTTPVEGQPGWYWDNFDTTLPMSTYLVAFIVSDFISRSSHKNENTLFRVWARREAIDQTDYALATGPDVLTFFEDYFSIPFPLPKQDMAALPDFRAGAMENWGLITYRETALLYDPKLSAASNKQRVGVVIAHELAHQWFGDLVTPSWWSDLWLNEGFASYMEYIGLDSVEPDFKMLEQFVIDDLQHVFVTDSLESSHPISVEVSDPEEISQIFDSISYSKGASIIRMMKHFLTEATFRQGLTNYLNAFRYSSAMQDDLWAYLTEQAHKDGTLDKSMTVKQIMDTWTLQMGYPVVTVTRNEDGTADITQRRFRLEKTEIPDMHEYTWWIPLTYVTEENPDFSQTTVKEWMSDTEKDKTLTGFPSKEKWAIFNVQENAYYRVNYDLQNWNVINRQLKEDYTMISTLNRAQIIDDTLNLARGGLLEYGIVLDVNSYMKSETKYVPWKSSMNSFSYLENMFTRTAAYGSMKDYLLSLSIPLYESVGFKDDVNDPHTDQLKRADVLSWTCNLHYEDCLVHSTRLYNKWMANPDDNTIISPNLKRIVYCYGIAEGDETEWDFAWNMYLKSNVAADQNNLLSAMGCSKIPWILQRYLELTFQEGSAVRKQDSYRVFDAVALNDYGRDIAWAYLQTNWDAMASYYGSAADLGDFTYTVASSFNTGEDMKELMQLKEDHYEDLGSATQSFDQAIENTQNNLDWMNSYYTVINSWLVDNGYGDNIRSGSFKKRKWSF